MIDFQMITQPNDEACGIACLQAIYQYYNLPVSYEELDNEIERSLSGGTFAPLLGKNALQRGFKVTLYTNNLVMFDPTWFNHEQSSRDYLKNKLSQQLKYKKERLYGATNIFFDYLDLGGEIQFKVLNIDLLEYYFLRHIPIITGLNSTYLYGGPRDRFDEFGNCILDDVGGKSCGHFVVLYGHEKNEKSVIVADPYLKNPLEKNYYKTPIDKLINAIMLGLSTYDGNLLIIEPPNDRFVQTRI